MDNGRLILPATQPETGDESKRTTRPAKQSLSFQRLVGLTGVVIGAAALLVAAARAQGSTIQPPVIHPPVAARAAANTLISLQLLASPTAAPSLLGGGSPPVADGVALEAEGSFGSDILLSDVPASDRIALYIVRQGDTLSQIAQMFGVSVNTIRWANNLTSSDLIKPGQELLILPISGVRYTVKKGDTLASIAKRFHGDTREIITYNGLTSAEDLKEGMTIVIPGGEMPHAPSTSRAIASRSSGRVLNGFFINPLPGAVRTQGLHGWNAVDLAAPYGTPILAAASGEVIVARPSGWNGGYGQYVVIRHNNGTQTLYSHLSKVTVYVGQSVVQGQVIGYVGSTGRSTGPHLHFEVRGAANPFAY